MEQMTLSAEERSRRVQRQRNARSPSVEQQVAGMISCEVAAEHVVTWHWHYLAARLSGRVKFDHINEVAVYRAQLGLVTMSSKVK